jgi:bifunctional DNA-binding transcriptional regulator/antitoxin component of YhaV-PrlF toxin-antitoxin module
MVVKLDSKRRLTLPKSLSSAKPGDVFEVSFDQEEDTVIFKRVPKKKNWLEVLKSCPVPMDDLPPRSREIFKSRL